MKKLVFDWRLLLLTAEIIAALVLLMAEPTENAPFFALISTLIASKLLCGMMVCLVLFQAKLWRNRYDWMKNLLS